MRDNKKEMSVAAIKNGTVIDHIPADKLFKVVRMLGLDRGVQSVTIGNNLISKKMDRKGIIKISDRFFALDEINRIALLTPNVVLSEIRDYEVVEKHKVSLPKEILGLVRCSNPKCITNNEPMSTRFDIPEKGELHCCYCEHKQSIEDIELL